VVEGTETVAPSPSPSAYLIHAHPFGDWFRRFYRTVVHTGDLIRTLKRALTDQSSGV